MRKDIQGRLARLVEARQEQDAATVKGIRTAFLEGLTPETLYACREPATLRPLLTAFLATQPAKVITTIERWSARRGKR